MTNEKLIAEAVAQAMSESDDRNHEELCHCGDWPTTCVTYGERKPWSHDAESVARAALAVFEKAHAPTDDEREALTRVIYESQFMGSHRLVIRDDQRTADAVLAAGFRRSEVPEPSVLTICECYRDGSEMVTCERHTEPSAGPKHDESCAEWCNHCTVCGEGTRYGSRCPQHYQNQPQGEPSDAQIEAALQALGHARSGVTTPAMRSALRAASAVTEQEGTE